MDIVDELKEQGQALNESSMYGDGGELLFRAAEEIVKLRGDPEDVTARLREKAKAMTYEDGDLLVEAATEIENLRRWREHDQKCAEEGFQQAYEMIVSMRDNISRQMAEQELKLYEEFEKAKQEMEAHHAAGDCGQSVLLGQGIDPQTGLPVPPPVQG